MKKKLRRAAAAFGTVAVLGLAGAGPAAAGPLDCSTSPSGINVGSGDGTGVQGTICIAL
jgi:hypothetical protein